MEKLILYILLTLIENLKITKKDITPKKKKLLYNITKMETPVDIMEDTTKMETIEELIEKK